MFSCMLKLETGQFYGCLHVMESRNLIIVNRRCQNQRLLSNISTNTCTKTIYHPQPNGLQKGDLYTKNTTFSHQKFDCYIKKK